MNKAQKEVQLGLLKSEEECVKALERAYRAALKDINAQIKQYQGDDLTQSQIYQRQYQEALKAQVETILDKMNADQYGTIQGYLSGCYQDSFAGVMYDLKSQGIPVTVPIQQDQVVKAVTTDSKLSKPMYEAMGKYLKPLKKRVAAELSRGFASGLHYYDIARNIEQAAHIGLYNAQRIARTEGHRIQCAAALDAQKAAKEAGADVVKQWDATMDGRTRKDHRKLDGQIREIDEPFEVGGHKAMAPGQFGRPEEDIHCRCAILQRAKWALDDDELEALKKKEEFWGLENAKSFEEYKKAYKKQSSKVDTPEKLDDAIAKAESEEYEQAKKKALDDLQAQLDETMEELDTAQWKLKKAKGIKKNAAQAQVAKHKIHAIELQKKIDGIKSGEIKVAVPSAPKPSDQLKQQAAAANAVAHPGDAKALKKKAKEKKPENPGQTKLGGFNGAKRFRSKQDSYDYYFDSSSQAWKGFSQDEREALKRYTGSDYRWMNGMLRRGEYVSGKVRDYRDAAIEAATTALERTGLREPVVVRRGTDASGVAGLFNVGINDLKDKAVQDALVGQRVIERGFMSTGAADSSGFSGINFEILLPEGTKGIYAEPFSEFGHTSPHELWDGEKRGWQVGRENEFIVQRNSTFEIVRIDSDERGYITNVVMRLVEQTLE